MCGLCDHGSITFASDWSGHAAWVAAPLHDASGARHRAPRHQLTLGSRTGGAGYRALSDQSSHDRDGDVARDDRAGRAGDVGGRELCGDLSSRRGPSPAGGSQAGEGGEEPGQGEPRRLNFRSAQFMHGGAGDVVTTKLVKMLSLRGRVRPRGDRRRPIKSAHGLLSIGIVRVRRHTRKKLTQTSLSHLRMGRAAHRQYPGHPSIGSPSATRPARRRCWPG